MDLLYASYAREIEANVDLEDQFQIFSNFQLLLPIYYFSEGVKACLESLWTKYRH